MFSRADMQTRHAMTTSSCNWVTLVAAQGKSGSLQKNTLSTGLAFFYKFQFWFKRIINGVIKCQQL